MSKQGLVYGPSLLVFSTRRRRWRKSRQHCGGCRTWNWRSKRAQTVHTDSSPSWRPNCNHCTKASSPFPAHNGCKHGAQRFASTRSTPQYTSCEWSVSNLIMLFPSNAFVQSSGNAAAGPSTSGASSARRRNESSGGRLARGIDHLRALAHNAGATSIPPPVTVNTGTRDSSPSRRPWHSLFQGLANRAATGNSRPNSGTDQNLQAALGNTTGRILTTSAVMRAHNARRTANANASGSGTGGSNSTATAVAMLAHQHLLGRTPGHQYHHPHMSDAGAGSSMMGATPAPWMQTRSMTRQALAQSQQQTTAPISIADEHRRSISGTTSGTDLPGMVRSNLVLEQQQARMSRGFPPGRSVTYPDPNSTLPARTRANGEPVLTSPSWFPPEHGTSDHQRPSSSSSFDGGGPPSREGSGDGEGASTRSNSDVEME